MPANSDDADRRSDFPTQGRLIGVDYGTKRVGIAICDVDQRYAGALETLQRSHVRMEAKYFIELAQEHRAKGIVVGLPVHMSGDEGGKAAEARQYGQFVQQVTGLPLRFWDERLTSAIAEEYLLAAELSKKKRKARIDKLAAQIMLQGYLDAEDKTAKPQGW